MTHFMDLSKINTSVLEGLIKLTKKRDALLVELKKLEAAIAGVYSGAKPNRAPVARGKERGIAARHPGGYRGQNREGFARLLRRSPWGP